MPTPSALYIHLPFCIRRCAYCAFASSVYEEGAADAYLEALFQEGARQTAGMTPTTVYVGGGTPTSLSAAQLERLLAWIQALPQERLEEFSGEANPGTLTPDKARLLRDAGVTRVSVGIQTFDPQGLRLLGRAHTAKQAHGAVALLREEGFEAISGDLLCGWPGQTADLWRCDLAEALRLDLPHLSCYGLHYEPGTPLHAQRERGQLRPLGEEEDRLLFDLTGEILEANGRPRYEISNFAIPGRECRHNRVYWTGGEYIGIGAGAFSYVAGVRFANEADVQGYVRALHERGEARAFEESLPPERRARECAVIWLRLTEGIEAAGFRDRTGFDLEALLAGDLPTLLEGGWLAWNADRTHLRLTAKTLPVADSVLAELVG